MVNTQLGKIKNQDNLNNSLKYKKNVIYHDEREFEIEIIYQKENIEENKYIIIINFTEISQTLIKVIN